MATLKEVRDGLNILSKYLSKGEESYVTAQHDILFAGPGLDGGISDEDKKKLEDLGWHFDEEFDCWARFT